MAETTFNDDQRIDRQGKDTIFQQLLEAGFTKEDIFNAAENGFNNRVGSIHLALFQDAFDSDPVVGIAHFDTYVGNQVRASLISTRLKEAEDQTSVSSHKSFGSSGAFIISLEELVPMDDHMKTLASLTLEKHWSPVYDLGDVHRYSAADLRRKLKGKVKPLPSNKDELQKAYAKEILKLNVADEESIGELHGQAAFVMATNEPILLKVLEILFEDSVKNNSLRFESTRNNLTQDYFFFDERDLSFEEVLTREKDRVWAEEKLKKVSEVISKLEEKGEVRRIEPKFFSSRELDGKNEQGTFYYLDYSPNTVNSLSVRGFYSYEELLVMPNYNFDFSRAFRKSL